MLPTGKGKFVTSVPIELSVDHTRVLDLCAATARTTTAEVRRATGWPDARVKAAIDYLMQNEIAWIDTQASQPTYWVMGLLHAAPAS